MGRFSHLPTSSSSYSYTSINSTCRRRSGTSQAFPIKFLCGLDHGLRTSTTVDNPGRRFYGCQNYDDGGYHIMKWWDEVVMEEFHDLTERVNQHGQSIDAIWVSFADSETVIMMKEDILKAQRDLDKLKAQLAEKPAVDIELKHFGDELFHKMMVAGAVLLALIFSVCVGFRMF